MKEVKLTLAGEDATTINIVLNKDQQELLHYLADSFDIAAGDNPEKPVLRIEDV